MKSSHLSLALACLLSSIAPAVHAQASQPLAELCTLLTANTWVKVIENREPYPPDTLTWSFSRDGTFTRTYQSDYTSEASGRWFIPKTHNGDATAIEILVTGTDIFAGPPSGRYTVTFSGGYLSLGGVDVLKPQGAAMNKGGECVAASADSQFTLRAIEKLAGTAWESSGLVLNLRDNKMLTNTGATAFSLEGKWDLSQRKKIIGLKGYWKEYPLLIHSVGLKFRYAIRGNRLIVTLVSIEQDKRFPSRFKEGDRLVLMRVR